MKLLTNMCRYRDNHYKFQYKINFETVLFIINNHIISIEIAKDPFPDSDHFETYVHNK